MSTRGDEERSNVGTLLALLLWTEGHFESNSVHAFNPSTWQGMAPRQVDC